MTHKELVQTRSKGARIALIILILIAALSMMLSWMVQTDFGRVNVTRVRFTGENGKVIAAKLMVPDGVDADNPAPGLIYLHGYQNNKETNAPYCIEAARRGFVVLNIDTLGRGKSQAQINENKPGFDPVFGAQTAWDYLLDLPMVDAGNCGLMGHSLGAEMVYAVAASDTRERALVTSGFAWLDDAAFDNPKNMLMIFGKYDEYRNRMSGTADFESEWMSTDRVAGAVAEASPEFNTRYGSFADGTARMVYMPMVTHIRESYDPSSISTAMVWLKDALGPDPSYWIDPDSQTWQFKELASLIAMISGILILLPLSLILIRTSFFADLRVSRDFSYTVSRRNMLKYGGINGLLILLYLPLILTLFGFHVYVVRIDFIFPLMMVNGVLIWFLVTNWAGSGFLKKWKKKGIAAGDFSEEDLGLRVERKYWKKTLLFSLVMFAVVCLLEAVLEGIFASDYRFIFPYASSFTPFRFLLFIEYSLLFFPGFVQLQRFLFIQLRLAERKSWLGTWIGDGVKAVLLMILPLILMLAVQYIPLYLTGVVPIVGPGASLIGFIMNLEHMIVLLSLILPVGAWLYRITGNATAGAMTSALIAAWFFTTSSVLAPVPV